MKAKTLNLKEALEDACEEQRDLALKTFGESVKVTRANCLRAVKLGLKIEWLARRVIPWPALAEYQKVRGLAYAEYERVRRVACAEYKEVYGTSWGEYQNACWLAYDKFQKTCGLAFCKVFNMTDEGTKESAVRPRV